MQGMNDKTKDLEEYTSSRDLENLRLCPYILDCSKDLALLMIGGGYVISPLPPQGGYPHRCLVKHMLTVDWKHWKTCWSPPRDKDITLRVLERVAGKLVYDKLFQLQEYLLYLARFLIPLWLQSCCTCLLAIGGVIMD
jgi:hypothetical protein